MNLGSLTVSALVRTEDIIMNNSRSLLLWFSFSELDSNDPSGMKNSLKLEGDSMDGSFANKHGCHIIGHIDDYTALREQIGEGKQLVEKIQSLLRPTCNFLGLEAQSSEVVTPVAPGFTLSLCPLSLILVSSPLFTFVACISQ